MADRFTGFWDAQSVGVDDEVATTIVPVDVDVLVERLRERLKAAPPGARIRIDLIAWGDNGGD